MSELQKTESKQNRNQRHKEHLSYLITSKTAKMNRTLAELIDNIHTDE